ncbi:MAG: metal ABC transporter permease [Oscillospiraceae bacterium]|jgi:zinc transport system permease protein|nr:metal ABC transporter permease [Oscillospiraceae bacterium]
MPFSWVGYNFMKNAFIAIILIAPVFGWIGTMVVHNKMAFFSDALGHCALTGVAIGTLLGLNNPILTVFAFAIVFALGIASVIEVETSSADTIVGVFASTGLAFGIVVLSLSGTFSKFSGVFIGDLLSITFQEIKMLAVVFLIISFVWSFLFNKLMLANLNKDLAVSKQINYKFYKNIFIILIALVVTIAIKWVGILIINSLLTIPAASARNLACSLRQYTFLTIAFSLFSGISGLILSFYMGTSAAATIVIVAAVLFFVTLSAGRFKKI